MIKAIEWRDGKVSLIDQTRLPLERVQLELDSYKGVVRAIKELRIRGAPAIGVAGAYAVALAAQEVGASEVSILRRELKAASEVIASARPTAVNLAWAVQRMLRVADGGTTVEGIRRALVAEAARIQEEDEEANHTLGRLGAELIPPNTNVLTHCNTGSLATGGYGTALGVIKTAWEAGKVKGVFVDETRPVLQGARLTAWELVQEGIPATLIADSAAGYFIGRGEVGCVVVGADRIAANGDVANKIGTYTLAVLAGENGIPFYVAAPTSTIDLSLPSGGLIPIEERPPEEVTHPGGIQISPEGVGVRNPAFDVTPHSYVTAIITEKGVAREPYEDTLKAIMEAVGA